MNRFWVTMLVLACIASLMLGYAYGTYLEQRESVRDLSAVYDYPSVAGEGTVEAQGSLLWTYDEYEAQVVDAINEKGKQ